MTVQEFLRERIKQGKPISTEEDWIKLFDLRRDGIVKEIRKYICMPLGNMSLPGNHKMGEHWHVIKEDFENPPNPSVVREMDNGGMQMCSVDSEEVKADIASARSLLNMKGAFVIGGGLLDDSWLGKQVIWGFDSKGHWIKVWVSYTKYFDEIRNVHYYQASRLTGGKVSSHDFLKGCGDPERRWTDLDEMTGRVLKRKEDLWREFMQVNQSALVDTTLLRAICLG
jgi:hypothetical protein